MVLVPAAVAVAGGLAAGGYVWAGRWPTSQLFGRTLIAGHDPQELALTFDDGPHERWTAEILEFLANAHVRATFFMVGRFAQALPWLVRQVRAAGHTVGSHTMTHPNLLWASPARVQQELQGGQHTLEDLLGEPVRFFRPPYAGRRPDVLRAVRGLGLQPVLWNATSYDWKPQNSAETISSNLQNAIGRNRRRGRGSNLLLHDGSPEGPRANRARTSTAVPMVIERMKEQGMRFVTVDHWAPRAEV